MFEYLKQFKRNKAMRIVVNGHPALRRVSEPVVTIDEEAKKLAENLLDSLKNSETPGCGLAAPQEPVRLGLHDFFRKLRGLTPRKGPHSLF